MAVVNGTIVGTGQVVLIELPSARVPELPDFEEIADDDELAGYDTSDNKTKGMKISQLRAKINGSAIPQTPVVSGADMEIEVPVELNGQTRIDVPALAGLNYSLERIGPDGSSRYISSWFQTLSTGGWELTRPGDKLYAGEYWIAHIYELEGGNSTSPGPSVGQPDKGFKTIDSTYELIQDDIGYTFNISGGSNKLTITLLALADTADKTELPFTCMINSDFKTIIKTKNGEFIYIDGRAVTQTYIGKGETLKLKKAIDGWYAIPGTKGNFTDAGQPVAGYSSMLNTLVAEGQLIRKDSEPRLWEAVQAMGDALIEDSLWKSSIDYQGCYSMNIDGNPDMFRLPDLRATSIRFLDRGRGLETNARAHNFPGGYQADAVGPHVHNVKARAHNHEGSGQLVGGAMGPSEDANVPTEINSGNGSGSETTTKNTGFLALIKT